MYFVRADGNAKIGAGHMMRCLTIAEELKKLLKEEEEVFFLCADAASALWAEEKGFQAKVLGTDYRHMESELPIWEVLLDRCTVKQGIKAQGTGREPVEEKRIEGHSADKKDAEHTILVDSYYVTDQYLRSLQRFGRVFLLDDMQQKKYPVDGVINYNAFATEQEYRKLYQNEQLQLCIGSNYVPVRPQFIGGAYQVRSEVKNVLITTGGGDVDNIAGEILQQIYKEEITYHLVIGRYNPHLQELTKMSEERGGIVIHQDVKDMAALMRRCDLAITAGGTTIYELAVIGVPLICFSYAENQERLTEYIGQQGIAGFAGAYHKNRADTLVRIEKLVKAYSNSGEKRNACYEKERKMIDGKGAVRLAQALAVDV